MTIDNLKKHLKIYRENGDLDAERDILKKYPELAKGYKSSDDEEDEPKKKR